MSLFAVLPEFANQIRHNTIAEFDRIERFEACEPRLHRGRGRVGAVLDRNDHRIVLEILSATGHNARLPPCCDHNAGDAFDHLIRWV